MPSVLLLSLIHLIVVRRLGNPGSRKLRYVNDYKCFDTGIIDYPVTSAY
jgi:hypothetical protein